MFLENFGKFIEKLPQVFQIKDLQPHEKYLEFFLFPGLPAIHLSNDS